MKPSPIRFLCVCDRVQRDRGTIDEHSHFDVETGKQKDYWKPLYTSTTIRKAFNDLAGHLANNDTHCFCDVEVRKRSEQW